MPATTDKRCDMAAPIQYDIESIETLDALRELEPEWRSFIAEGSNGANFFNDPKHIDIQLQKDPDAVPWILVLRRGGRIRCIAPLYVRTGNFSLRLSVITLGSVAVQIAKIFGDSFIVAVDEEVSECYSAVFDVIWQHRSRFAMIRFECLESATPLWDYCQSQFASAQQFRLSLASTQLEKLHYIRFPATHDAFLSARSPKSRQKVRRYIRTLCDTQNARLQTITTADQVARFLNQLDQIHRDSWQGKTFGYQTRNTEAEARYLTQLSNCGWLRSYVLENDRGPIAFVFGLQYGKVYHFLETGYVQAWSEFSPGIVLMHLLFEDLYRIDPPQLLSFGVGDAVYKQSFSNFELSGAAALLLPPNRWRYVASIQNRLNAFERGLRSVAVFLNCDRILRKLLKRQS